MTSVNYFLFKKKKKNSDPFLIKTGKFGEARNKSFYRPAWAEDAYIGDSNKQQELVGQNFNVNYLFIIAAFISILLLLLLAKIAWLQIAKGDYYRSMAEGNRIRTVRIEPQRGVIFDSTGNALVHNKPNFLLYFIPVDLPVGDDLDALILEIEKIIDSILAEEIKAKLAKINRLSLEAYQPLFVDDNIEYEKAMKIYLKSSDWPGVVLTNKSVREYYYVADYINANSAASKNNLGYSLSLAHVLGYTGKINEEELKKYGSEYLPIDYIGKMGVEYFWENELKGLNGKKQIEVDALGKEKKIIGEVSAIPGNSLVLALDINQQIKMESLLKKELEKLHLQKGIAIVMDPNNGGILALVSLPAFDNNAFARGISRTEYETLIKDPNQPLFNRAVSGEYPSGSTIKPVMAAAALEEGVIDENTSIISTGGIRIGQWFFPDWRAGGHGVTDVRKAIAQSVNTFFYYIGGGFQNFSGLGLDKIVYYEKMFGLGSQTGVDLAGESDGFLPTSEWKEKTKNEKWYIGDTYHISIGQGDLLVTPLQVAMYVSFFANGGTLYRPHLVKSVINGATKISEEVKNDPIREGFIKPYNVRIVREGMRQTVTSGSASRLQSVPVPVAGKTGTAQWATDKNPHGWFVAFAPYEEPEIAIVVMIEAGGEGSSVATPIAQDYLTWYFRDYKNSE